ncbi:hypothetical protein KIL84_023109 [Mauremys mutica]|uniref:Uncharacterized protein n=1 Tax=Mauremys mutica TaxID=74926 RepID=A0A9D3WRW0_9SAUR|nr:hypothetical protein KIL84_023109 [Mauremys mutica]
MENLLHYKCELLFIFGMPQPLASPLACGTVAKADARNAARSGCVCSNNCKHLDLELAKKFEELEQLEKLKEQLVAGEGSEEAYAEAGLLPSHPDKRGLLPTASRVLHELAPNISLSLLALPSLLLEILRVKPRWDWKRERRTAPNRLAVVSLC